MPRRTVGFGTPLACLLLTVMLLLMVGSVRDETLTYDEPVHITAGYAHLRFRDARLNPEHPPLLKMLAATPLMPLGLHFPLASPAWQDDLNGQWQTAHAFLYESGNDPSRITALARLGRILLTAALGLVVFLWTRRFAGDMPALLTLLLYALSPTILAHGRLVTTDVAATLGVVLTVFALVPFLRAPGAKTALPVGLALGIALLCKFSTVLLLPFCGAMAFLWMTLKPELTGRYLAGLVMMGGSAALLVLLPYLWTTADYPPERQFRDAYMTFFHVDGGPAGWIGDETMEEYLALLKQDRTRDLQACAGFDRHSLRRCPAELAIFLAGKPLLRAWGQYLTGLVWTEYSARAGGTVDFPFYFLGEVSALAWWRYFPIVYAIREPLPLHLLTGLALLLTASRLRPFAWQGQAIIDWLRGHPAETCMLIWVAFYWGIAVCSNLNIGVRHLLPVFPLTMVLVACGIGRWWMPTEGVKVPPLGRRIAVGSAITLLLIWQGVSVLRAYPFFLAYFNESIGGSEHGANYVVDHDWGQDLGRLRAFVETQEIAVDYFGTSSPRHELGATFLPWRPALGPYEGWLAVSVAILRVAHGRWDHTLTQRPEEAYEWLRSEQPVALVGRSILVFDLRHGREAFP